MKILRNILIAGIVLVSFEAIAQTSIGVRAGINLGNWRLSTTDPVDLPALQNHSGIIVSIPVEFSISPLFSLQPEFTVIEKGTKSKILSSIDNYPYIFTATEEDVIKLNYIEIPVICKFGFGSEKVKFNFLAGPSMGYAVGGTVDSKLIVNGKTIESQSVKINFKDDQFSRYDFALNFGGALNIKTKTGSVFIDARYQLGITDISTEPENNTTAANIGIELTAGYLFLLPGKNKEVKK